MRFHVSEIPPDCQLTLHRLHVIEVVRHVLHPVNAHRVLALQDLGHILQHHGRAVRAAALAHDGHECVATPAADVHDKGPARFGLDGGPHRGEGEHAPDGLHRLDHGHAVVPRGRHGRVGLDGVEVGHGSLPAVCPDVRHPGGLLCVPSRVCLEVVGHLPPVGKLQRAVFPARQSSACRVWTDVGISDGNSPNREAWA